MIQTRPELAGSFGMVASTHWIASGVGMSVLENGGNAADAAVAAGFVLQVVEPHMCGPGGDLAALVWDSGTHTASEICGQGVAPASLTSTVFRDLGLDLVPGSGLLAATVPGAFGGWLALLERFGTWELADVLRYAIHYAEHGFPLLPDTAAAIAGVEDLFRDHWPTSAPVWLDHGRVPRAREDWRLPAVAATYRRILAEATGTTREQRIEGARRAFYEGFVAETIATFNRSAWLDTSGRPHAGHLVADDLASWRASIAAPLSTDFGGHYSIIKTGPWGQGPVLAQQALLFEAAGVFELAVRSPEWIHRLTEAAKLAFADREAWYGDPAFVDVPLEVLLSREYARERAALIDEQASWELRPGAPGGRPPRLASLGTAGAEADRDGAVGEPTLAVAAGPGEGDTCHVDVVDRWGNLVAVTPSGGWLQSSPVVPELGFALGTRAQMFRVEDGLASSVRPGARPRTTLTPSIALRDGEPWLAFGSPGGDQQDQWQAVFLADVVQADLGGGANLQAAIDAPMFHSAHFPSSFYPRESRPGELLVEDRLGDGTIRALEGRGHRVVRAGAWSLGRLSAVAREGGQLRAAANPRGAQGYAVGR